MKDYSRLPAIVLAGGVATQDVRERYSVENRAAVQIVGKSMAQHVVDALAGAANVSDICLIGDTPCEGVAQMLPSGDSLIENLVTGITSASGGNPDIYVLVATSDIPFLTSAAVDDFIERCGKYEADFYYPVIAKGDNDRQFPGMHRTYARMSEGTFTGGNIMLMRAGFVMQNADVIRDVFAARKSITRLARIIGLGVLIRVAMAQGIFPKALDLGTLERTAGRILKTKLKAVQTPYAGIGADVDNIEQFEAAERILSTAGDTK